MTAPGHEERQRQGFRAAFEAAGLPLEDIWLAYFGVGGMNGLVEVNGYLHGILSFSPLERDLLARALNETLDGMGVDGLRATYSQELPREDHG